MRHDSKDCQSECYEPSPIQSYLPAAASWNLHDSLCFKDRVSKFIRRKKPIAELKGFDGLVDVMFLLFFVLDFGLIGSDILEPQFIGIDLIFIEQIRNLSIEKCVNILFFLLVENGF